MSFRQAVAHYRAQIAQAAERKDRTEVVVFANAVAKLTMYHEEAMAERTAAQMVEALGKNPDTYASEFSKYQRLTRHLIADGTINP